MVENASNLATLISESYKKLNKLKGDIDDNINSEIKQINDMLKSLEDLNKSIDVISGSGSTPNDLLDERDRILDDLSFKLDLENSDVKNMLSDGKLELNELKMQMELGKQVYQEPYKACLKCMVRLIHIKAI